MSTRANIIVIESNGDYSKQTQFYRHCDGYLSETGKNLAIVSELALTYCPKEGVKQDGGNYTFRRNFRQVRDKFFQLLKTFDSYEQEADDTDIHGDIEYLYRVLIERVGDDVVIKVTYVEIPVDTAFDKILESKDKLLSGNGYEVKLNVNSIPQTVNS